MPFSPSDFLRHKQLLPSQARTAEWDAASDRDPATAAWVKERAFFMAGVARAGRLQEFRNAAAAVAQGTMSAAMCAASWRPRGTSPMPGWATP